MTTKVSLEEKFRQTGGKRSYVQRLFGRIARIYDPMNRLMSLGLDQHWRAFAARYLALGTGDWDSTWAPVQPTSLLQLFAALDQEHV